MASTECHGMNHCTYRASRLDEIRTQTVDRKTILAPFEGNCVNLDDHLIASIHESHRTFENKPEW